MKKVAVVLLGTFAFACGGTDNNAENSNLNGTTDESVEIGSGNEVSPQLDLDSDTSNTLQVDTVSSTTQPNR